MSEAKYRDRPDSIHLWYQKWFKKNDINESYIWVLNIKINLGNTITYLNPGLEHKGHYLMDSSALKLNYYRDLEEVQGEEKFAKDVEAFGNFRQSDESIQTLVKAFNSFD